MKGIFTSWTLMALTALLSLTTSVTFSQSNHTVTFTGSSADFNAVEKVSAAAGNTDYYITFDASNLYLGAFRTAGSFNTADNFTVYLDTDPNSTPASGAGTTAGQSYNGVTGTLPFTANYNLHAEQSFQEARSAAGSWASTISGLTYNTGSTWREVTIPFSSIGNPDALYITMWMGNSGSIFSNAPGADLGAGANPTITDYIGGFGVSSVDCIPVNTTNTPITASLTNAAPAAGITYGKITISFASITASNNFNIASGGSLIVSGGAFDISGRTITMGGSSAGTGRGTTIDYSGGTLTSSSATSITFNGEGRFIGNALTYEGALVINRKFTPAGSGTTLGTAGSIDLRANSFVQSNALTYSAGSTLMYNTGNTFVASTEWLANLSSGTGVPSNVIIGNNVANSVVSFGASAQFRRATGDVTISNATGGNGLTLSSAAGGDIRFGGNFTQNGTFTANARTVTLNGTTTQTYSGLAADNINTLVVSNTSATVNLNNSVNVSSALTFNANTNTTIGASAIIVMAQGSTLTANNAGSSVAVNGTLRNTGTSGATINSNAAVLSFGSTGTYDHNMTRSGSTLGPIPTATWNTGSTVLISGLTNPTPGSWFSAGGGQTFHNFTWNTPSMSTAPNMGGATLTATGIFTITSTNGQELRMGTGTSGTITCGGYSQANGVLNLSAGTGSGTLNCSGTFNQTAGSISETGSGTAHLIHFNGSANQSITFASSPSTDVNYRFNNPNGFTLNSAISIANNRTVTHTQGVFAGAGSISYGATGTNLVYNGSSLLTSSNYEWPSSNGPVNVTINNAGGINLHAARTIGGVLTMTSGIFTLGNNNLTISNNATAAITGTYSASNMIATTGTGQLIRAVNTGGNTYIWPVGDNTGTAEYSPTSLVFTANSATRNIGVIVTDGDHFQVNNLPVQTDYISRYWSFTNSAAGTYTYTGSFTYAAADLTGSQSNIRANLYNGSAWIQDSGSSSSGNVITTATGLTQVTGPITTTTDVTGRVNNRPYTWNQTGTSSWTTAGNWTPARTTPRTDDILIFNNGATTTATNVPVQTIGQLLISAGTNVSLTTGAANTLTIAGSNGADLSIAAGSTLQLASIGTNAITVAFTNSTVSSIDGTLTLGANTGLTNAINFTNSTATVNGSVNSQGVITSTGANLLFAASSFYNHNFQNAAGIIPTATWNTTSTCRIQGYTGGGGADFSPAGLNQSFGNFTWNCTGQTNDAQLDGGLTTINGNFTVSSTGGGTRDLRLTDNTSYVLNIGGNLTISSNSTELRMAHANGPYTAVVNVGGNYVQSNTSTLSMNQGDGNTRAELYVAGNFTLGVGSVISQGSNQANENLIEFDGTASQAVTINGTLPNGGAQMDYRINNAAGIVLGGTIPVNDQSVFYRRLGAITGGTITYNSTGTTLEYEGTTAMTTGIEFPASNGPENVTINSTNIISLSASRSLPNGGIFRNTSGIFSLGSFDITLNNTATAALTNNSPSATNMIAADGSGQLCRALPNGSRDLQFYIGDITGTNEYSAIRLNFSANSLANRIVGVRVVDTASPDIATPYAINDYLSRHWIVTLSSSAGTFTYTPTLTYNVAGDVNGVENNLQVAVFPPSASAWNHYATSLTSPTIVTSSSLNQASFTLNNATFSGRTPSMYWTGAVDSNWNNTGNWNTNTIPTSTDNIDISTSTPNPCVLSGSASVNNLTLNQSGSLTLGSAAVLTVNGNFIYINTATASFDCSSTVNLANTVLNQNIPALTYGNLNLGTGARTLANSGTISICGNYTSTTGTITTTGSTVAFIGTAAQSILSNTANFNNLTISNTTASVSATPNVNISGIMQINANARLNKTGGTLTINSGAIGSVDGFLRNSGTVTPTGTLTFTSSGIYEHNTTTPGTIPNSTWNSGSTCELIGNFSSGNLNCQNQNFHHFKVNYSGNGNVDCNGSLDAINGDFSCLATGTGDFIFASADGTTTILGDFIQSGGSIIVSDGNNNSELIEVAGNYSQTGGDMDMCNGISNSDGDFDLSGNYSRTGNGNITTSSIAGNGVFNFVGTNQTITETSTGLNTWIDYDVESGSTTTMLSDLEIYGTTGFESTFDINNGGVLVMSTFNINGGTDSRMRINSGSTIRTANVDGINSTGGTGSVQTSIRSFSSAATYEFNGTSNQNTGTFFTTTSTANTVANLIFNNTAATVTLNSGTSPTVTDVMTFGASNTANFNVGAQTVYASNTALGAVVRSGSGHVIGNLRRGIIPSATNTYTFHVGTSSAYSPVVSALTMGAGAGSIIAKVTDGGHPNMATNGLSQAAYVNRFWTLTNSGSTITSASHEFNYVPADLMGGATAATLRLARYSAGWTLPTYISATDKITGTALTNTTGFGDFFAAADCSNYTAAITPASSTTFCNGGSVALTGSSNVSGSTFAWSPATGLDTATGANVVASPTSTVTYTLTATSPQICVVTDTITVTVNPRPTGVIAGTQTICNGESAVLSIDLTGTGPWSGTLSSGDVFSGSSSPISVSVSPSSASTYTIATLLDDNCTATGGDLSGSAVVSVNARPTGTLSGSGTICAGGSINLSIVVTGTGPWSGTLSNGDAFSGSSSPISVSVGPVSSITLTIATLSDSNCSANSGDLSGSSAITVIVPYVSINGTDDICYGGSSIVNFNGSPNSTVTYTINEGPIQTLFLNAGGFNSISTGVLTTTTSYDLVDVSIGVCTLPASGSAVITVAPILTAGIGSDSPLCQGSSTNVNFTGTPLATITYNFNGGSDLSITLDGSGNASVSTGLIFSSLITYNLVSIDDGNCSNAVSGSEVINTMEAPEAAISGSTAICSGSSTTISFEGTPGATVTYTVNAGPNETILLNGSGNASLVTDALTDTTTYDLVDATLGACTSTLTGNAIITMLSNQYFQDLDGDGFGNSGVSVISCTTPVGYVFNNTDCDDSDAAFNPYTVWYADVDGDGFGSYVFVTQCADPLILGVVRSGGDCNDNNPLIYPGASEVCANGIDDDCDGFVDEGCIPGPSNDQFASAVNVSTSGVAYPAGNCYNGTTLNATVSPQGTPANVLPLGGQDVWYKIVAPSPGLRVNVSTSAMDVVVELHNAGGTLIDTENSITGIGNEIMSTSGLTEGATYFIAVRSYTGTTGTFSICVQALMDSECSTGSGTYDLCTNLKPKFTSANQYIYHFTPTSFVGPTVSYTAAGQIAMSLPALGLIHGETYDVTIDAFFNLLNSIPSSDSQTIVGTTVTSISIADHADLRTKSTQVCPSTIFKGTTLQAKPFICSTVNNTIEFQEVTDCTGSTTVGPIFTTTTSGASPNRNLAQVAGIQAGKWYTVRWRPNFSYGPGVYGSYDIIRVVSSSSAEQEVPSLDEQPVLEIAIYPNPTNGDLVNIRLAGLQSSDIQVRIMDQTGKVVYNKVFFVDVALQTQLEFAQALSNGIYLVEIADGDSTSTVKMVVVN